MPAGGFTHEDAETYGEDAAALDQIEAAQEALDVAADALRAITPNSCAAVGAAEKPTG